MITSAENLRLIFGVKLKQLRHQNKFTLKDLADKTNLSFSYLSEIEKGKKYPKPEKILQIANALGVTFDEIVSAKTDESLHSVTSLLDSPVIKEFPFEFFGIAPRDVLELITNSPQEAGALIRTLLEIGRSYDMRVEQFLFAALRSYQKLHGNYFEDLETAANRFAEDHHWKTSPHVPLHRLKSVLVKEYGYILDETTLEGYSRLKGFRSVWVDTSPPRLLLNPRLLPSQKAFLMGREIGYRYLNLKEHTITSSWLKVNSFEEVLNNFKASYFSGALLMNRELLRAELLRFFQKKRWSSMAFLELMHRFDATPEMFAYRLSQLIPKFFDLQEMFYLRFFNPAGSDVYELTKELNMSRVLVPHGIGLNEHYCHRWLSIKLLKDLAGKQRRGDKRAVLAGAQRSHFLDSDAEFFVITVARSLALTERTNSSISLGFLMNEAFKRNVRFWDDPAIPRRIVNETCERCSLSSAQCHERVAPPLIYKKQQTQVLREEALQQLLQKVEGG